MDWVLRSPQIHSTFGNLGFIHGDGYHVNQNCNVALEAILHNILTEDKYLRTYRRSISFGQNIKKDLIPLLIHAKEEKTIPLLIKILVNLTIPVECLLSMDLISKTSFERHAVFEINNLLASTKIAFTDHRATKVIVEFLKKNSETDQENRLSVEQCTNISNSLLLLRNILHIPDDSSGQSPNYNGSIHSVQNQILWNMFSQSIDKILIKLMSIPDASNWGVTMVQLIALLYKDQHVITLHKLLNIWLEASISESSEDNESNTSPPDRGSDDSSPMLTSDPTSDSSDTGGSGKSNDDPNFVNNGWDTTSLNNPNENGNQDAPTCNDVNKTENAICDENHEMTENIDGNLNLENQNEMSCVADSDHSYQLQSRNGEKKNVISETSDCGYGTQIENHESISTSSNDDELPTKKPVHQKPHNPKQRANNKARACSTTTEKKRKKIVKRGKANIINVQGLTHKTPTDDDISNVLKEFTVDFLLKGYNSLVQTLHSQILTNMQLEIDTSHFFWLVTYFLKFATQIELDLEQVRSVLSFDMLSYMTAEGVNLCEQFELAIKLDGNNLKPTIRRLHLVVTAIREFVQAIEVYKKITHLCKADHDALLQLQNKIYESEELRSLLVLLIRHYNPKYHSKQYLQDIIVTNHILLMYLDNALKFYSGGSVNLLEHIRQFATPEIMHQYGLLLEDYEDNGEFVNDCIFTLMHHVGGELDSLNTLFQPTILKTFTTIWKSEFEICDDWSDLIEYVINTFIKKPDTLDATNFCLNVESFEDDKACLNLSITPEIPMNEETPESEVIKKSSNSYDGNSCKERWTDDELSSLSWKYMQCSSQDVIGEIVKLFKEDGIIKTRDAVINELFKQALLTKEEFDNHVKGENDRSVKSVQLQKELRDDEIGKLCEQLANDGKGIYLDWVQKVLLDTCFAKIYLDKKNTVRKGDNECMKEQNENKLLNFELFKTKSCDMPTPSPVSYHSLLYHQSVPLVPWNCQQASICKDLKFLQLLHRLGFHMPVDTGKVFIRIPHFWTAEFLYDIAGKVVPIDKTKLKFSIKDLITEKSIIRITQVDDNVVTSDYNGDVIMTDPTENLYQVNKQKHLATMVNFTPMPGSSFSSKSTAESQTKNWLQVVQKSQEYRIGLNLKSNLEVEEVEPDVRMELVGVEHAKSPPAPPHPAPASAADIITPTAMPVKQETSLFHIHIADPECSNHSMCETASVASDLTRMYVSDEDEKPAVLIPPRHAKMINATQIMDE